MSLWRRIKKEDIEYNPETKTLDILAASDNNGSIYAEVEIEHVLEIMKKEPTLKIRARPRCLTCKHWGSKGGGTKHRDRRTTMPCENPELNSSDETYLFFGDTDYFEFREDFGCVLHEEAK